MNSEKQVVAALLKSFGARNLWHLMLIQQKLTDPQRTYDWFAVMLGLEGDRKKYVNQWASGYRIGPDYSHVFDNSVIRAFTFRYRNRDGSLGEKVPNLRLDYGTYMRHTKKRDWRARAAKSSPARPRRRAAAAHR